MLNLAKIVAFIPTRDSDQARPFYENVLGLPVVSEDGFATVFDCHGIMLRVVKAPPFTPQPFTVLGWEVERIEDEIKALQARGVKFERFPGMPQDELGMWSAPGGSKVAWFKDPDGNILSLSQHG
jgi:catechol 2,3-dioxygenase-like lactoylglutathione lyase family enzyme